MFIVWVGSNKFYAETINEVAETIDLLSDDEDFEIYVAVSHIDNTGREHCDCEYEEAMRELDVFLRNRRLRKD